jgi:hypothetical protein
MENLERKEKIEHCMRKYNNQDWRAGKNEF